MIRPARLIVFLFAIITIPAGCSSERSTPSADKVSLRDNVRIVGSSTVFPFSAKAAQEFRNKTGYSVIVEATGSGGGHKLFCAGTGASTPDIVNSSRRQKQSEAEACAAIIEQPPFEIALGKDGIVFGQLIGQPNMDVSLKAIYLALAETIPRSDNDCTPLRNPNTVWSGIDTALPERAILVYGPPPTSGTRDTFAELVMQAGAREITCMAELEATIPEEFRLRAETLREDGRWIDSGENDNLIIQTLLNEPDAIGLFGYSFLEQNRNRVDALSINGVLPTSDTIRSDAYAISRDLFIYVKIDHLELVPPLRDFVNEILSDDAIGPDGYLANIGLVPASDSSLAASRTEFARLIKDRTP
ncbi:MAG: substrate-binding domain-containing protein [Pseudomonadota bacterium]